ncbi:hypothetical protein P691DRAFT_682988 [Macrolepiota fuliginosa MF-IS2]|uniref:Uncharacterized protein n=1 Tax=Macrolepiota fuliginosa MF-IS2 TaxID=1400762 RepID=A0A9P6BXQ9_9AGAR|nr:hypothetical protein P691DRAFT_682988 [Macrolepiota fuliginosa MF-IS2]
MKQLAACDFEDLLQCSIPAFEGLLVEPHNQLLLDLLFSLSCWHALAKLHLQTMSIIKFLQKSTQALGYYLQRFARTTCTVYDACELAQEVEAWGCQKLKDVGGKGKARAGGSQVQKLNLYTYKLHLLGDYPSVIQQYGTSDRFSTQVMSY